MRDPARIPLILELLGNIWRKNPDLRLGQLINNCDRDDETTSDIYQIEDDEMVKRLKDTYK